MKRHYLVDKRFTSDFASFLTNQCIKHCVAQLFDSTDHQDSFNVTTDNPLDLKKIELKLLDYADQNSVKIVSFFKDVLLTAPSDKYLEKALRRDGAYYEKERTLDAHTSMFHVQITDRFTTMHLNQILADIARIVAEKQCTWNLWYPYDCDRPTADRLKALLRQRAVYFEASENGDCIHLEIQASPSFVSDDLIDLLDNL